MNCTFPRTARKTDFATLWHLMPTFLRTDDSANELLRFLMWPFQRQQWVLLCNCLVGALPCSHYYAMRSSPLCGVRVVHPAQYDLTRQRSWQPPKNKQNKRYPGCLAHTVIGMFYNVVANHANSNIHRLYRLCCFTASVPTEANYFYIYYGARGESRMEGMPGR